MDAITDRILEFFQGESPFLQSVGQYGYKLHDEFDVIVLYTGLLLSALFPIYIGSHASLRRPPGGVCKDPKKLSQKSNHVDEHDSEDEDEPSDIEGLQPSDAIMFPILAGFTLTGLYFLIKWLNDPDLLNRVLGWYFSALGVLGVGKLVADGLGVLTTFIFPTIWASGQHVYMIEPVQRRQIIIKASAPMTTQDDSNTQSKVISPLPGVLSRFRCSESASKFLWSFRALCTQAWIFEGYIHGIISSRARVRMNDAIGYSLGLAAIVAYNYYGKAWWLTNLMGFGFCYGTLQLMSPTTFSTGSLVLLGLFVYDIVMVFYTPMMVSVATTLDVPIKLVFPGGKRGAMLGLGDVVLPGIMMALALRFDLFMFYLRKKRAMKQVRLQSPVTDKSPAESETLKPTYFSATGFQGERYWTSPSWFALLPWPLSLFSPNISSDVPESVRGGHFPKPYFTASLIGYVAAMFVTLAVLNIYNHAQPALLYLVPGVLGSLWGTGLIRGEIKEMWAYTEDAEWLEDEDETKAKAKLALMAKETNAAKTEESMKLVENEETSAGKLNPDEKDGKATSSTQDETANHVFLFSLSKPKPRQAVIPATSEKQ